MRIDQVSNLGALAFIAAVAVVAWVLFHVIPPGDRGSDLDHFSEEEITSYDHALPKYFLTALIALAIGALEIVVKNFPPLATWLYTGGEGGQLVRDIANSHLEIVLGGTITATGLTWFVLPRICRRPLATNKVAGASFWLTVVGAGGFYIANIVLGSIYAHLIHGGMGYEQARASLGVWRVIPIAVPATLMGIGYWTFVGVVVFTAAASRRVAEPRPDRYLIKFFVIGALGLFAGTVQGVIQVLPQQEAWLHAAGNAGHYIDPIAHAHVNLVTGTLALAAGIIFFLTRGSSSRKVSAVVFWTMIPGSLCFYVVFLALGFFTGHFVVADGMSFSHALSSLGSFYPAPIMAAGILTLIGVWTLLGYCVFAFRRGGRATAASRALICLGAGALFIGTIQGFIQLVPSVKRWIAATGQAGDALVNAHAQLNMLGGVLPIFIGLALLTGPVVIGVRGEASFKIDRLPHRVLGGAFLYYIGALLTAIEMGRVALGGGNWGVQIAAISPWGELTMGIGGALLLSGFGPFAVERWRSTAAYRSQGLTLFRLQMDRYNGDPKPWRRRIPSHVYVLAEIGCGAAGFPGIGWLLSGRALLGLPLALIGPAVAWAVLPLLASPIGNGPLARYGPVAAVALWLLVTTILSATALALSLRHEVVARAASEVAS